MQAAASRLVLISLLLAFVTRAVVMPVIAAARSYRPFMEEVNKRLGPHDKLFLYGGSFNSDPVVFYRGGPVDVLEQPVEAIAAKIGRGNTYVIMARQRWRKIQVVNPHVPPPLLESHGTKPEGDAPLVLVQIGEA